MLEYNKYMGFPGGSVARNPPADTGDRFDSWSGKSPHAAEPKLLSLHSRAQAPQQENPLQ